MIRISSSSNYNDTLKELKALGGIDDLSDLCNYMSYLFYSIQDINWIGIYLLKEKSLYLGPFQGKPACVEIPIGKGVCGTAVEKKTTQVVDDVEAFPGHIACDAESKSEIVVPIVYQGKIIGVLDVDSPVQGRFQEKEKAFFENFVKECLSSIQWQNFL